MLVLGIPWIWPTKGGTVLDQFKAVSRADQVEQSLRYEEEEIKKREQEKERNQQTLTPWRKGALILVGALIAGSLAYGVTGLPMVGGLASVAGLAVPALWIRWSAVGRHKQMIYQLEETLEIMASVMRSGGGLPSALETAVRDAKAPIRNVLQQAVMELRLGVTPAVVLQRLAARVEIKEMEMVGLALELQQGGLAVNLPAVLIQAQDNLRQRQAYAEEISALTAENRVAAWVIAMLPFIVVGLIRQMSPDFIAPLFEDPVGIGIFLFCTLLIGVGVLWILQMVGRIGKE